LNNPKNTEWFYFEPHVYTTYRRGIFLVYDTLTGRSYPYTGSRELLAFFRKTAEGKRNGLTPYGEKERANPHITAAVRTLREAFLADILPSRTRSEPPFRMTGEVKIQRDVHRLRKDPLRSVGENVLGYLRELIVYLTDACRYQCSGCRRYYRQFTCCTASTRRPCFLPVEQIIGFLDSLYDANLQRLVLSGGDLSLYPGLGTLEEFLNDFPFKPEVVVHIGQLGNLRKKRPRLWSIAKTIRVVITPPFSKRYLTVLSSHISSSDPRLQFVFVVNGHSQLAFVQRTIQKHRMKGAALKPFYTDKNLKFFKDEVFLELSDIMCERPLMREIYANQTINRLDFGSLVIRADGTIYANVNFAKLGRLGKESVYQVLCKELEHGASWLRTRRDVEPCRRCAYADLCPPLGNYEIAINRNNLCGLQGRL
jgi:pseudo-rSAM protein